MPDFTSVVKLAPNVAGYADNLARALCAAGQYEDALRASDRAIDLAPRMAFTHVGKAMTLEAAGRVGDALGKLESTMASAPSDAGFWEDKGKLLGELRRFRGAYAAFDQALALQPRRANVYIRRAKVETSEGRIDNAIGDLSRYPASGAEAELVRGELIALRAVHGRASERAFEQKTTEAHGASAVADRPAPTAKPRCIFHDWELVEECIEKFHNENDPLPSGAPNPSKREHGACCRSAGLSGKHCHVQWDRSEWNAIVAKDAEDTASE